jgi:orotate phosphoribosyltransferase
LATTRDERGSSLAPPSLSSLREAVRELILGKGYERRDTPFRLSSGEWSHDYIDGKRAIAAGQDLELVGRAILAVPSERQVTFDAVGGLSMGADPLAHAVSMLSGAAWFAVRKEPKKHGKQRLIEGVETSPGMRVLLVDDVVTTGASLLRALDAVEADGADVVLAVSVVDRGEGTARALKARGITYEPLLTYEDLGIDPVGS